jgi:hypothetical protein
MKRRKRLVLGLLLTGAVLLSAVMKTYRVSANSSPRLLCSERECYVFVQQVHNGWSGTYLVDAGRLIVSAFGGAVSPTDMEPEALVVRMTEAGMERTTFRGSVQPYSPYGDSVYVSGQLKGQPAVLLRWRDGDFAGLNKDEEAVYWTALRTRRLTNQQKWQEQMLNLGVEYPVQLGHRQVTFAWSRDSRGVEFLRFREDDKGAETLWSLDTSSRQVSEAEYARIFKIKG